MKINRGSKIRGLGAHCYGLGRVLYIFRTFPGHPPVGPGTLMLVIHSFRTLEVAVLWGCQRTTVLHHQEHLSNNYRCLPFNFS